MKVLSFDKKTYTLYCNSRSHPILFNSYEENGWKDSGWVKVPDSNFAFRIMSNFGYGNSAYLKYAVNYKEQMLVFSDSWCETKKLLTYWEEQPTTDYWGDLLKHIVDVYNKRDAWNYNNILSAATKLNHYLSEPELIEVSLHKWSNVHFNYSTQLKNIHLIEKCDELIMKIQELRLENFDNIREVISDICEKVIALIFKTYNSVISESYNTEKLRETYLERISRCFNTVYGFIQHTNQLHLLFCNKKCYQ